MTSTPSSWVAPRRGFRPSEFWGLLLLAAMPWLLPLAPSERPAPPAPMAERDPGARVRNSRASPQRPVADEFRSAGDMRGFVERHFDAADDAPTAYFISQALEECFAFSRALPMHRDRRRPDGAVPEVSWMEIAAAEALAAPCRGFEDRRIDSVEVMRLLETAAHAGDARARARMLLFRDVAAPKSEVIAELPELLATGDPMVVRDVGAFLARGETHWRLGGREVPVGAAVIAWELAACDLGYDCGASSRIVLAQCAFAGHCGAASHEDVLSSTEPLESLVEGMQLRARLVRALRQHDWNWLGL